MRKPEPEPVTAPPVSPLKSPYKFGWRLVSGLGAEAVCLGVGVQTVPTSALLRSERLAGPLIYLPSMQNPTVSRSDPKVYEKMALTKS